MARLQEQVHLSEHDPHFGVYHELMAFRVRDILLVSSTYDAYIMEEDGSLAMRIIKEYHGLNLTRPPRIINVSTVDQALGLLEKKSFDLVLTMPHLGSMDCETFACRVKENHPDLPVILLAHSSQDAVPLQEGEQLGCIDDSYIWCCDSKILVAIVKNVEDRRNVEFDTRKAMVRVVLYVEDSAAHRSRILPLLYDEVVKQTQNVLDEGLNDQHRLLKMRARPKILTARSYEEAVALFNRYHHNIYALLTDVRFPKEGMVRDDAGLQLIRTIRREVRDLPVLVLSTESRNRKQAAEVQAMFARKDMKTIDNELHRFFLENLGFGDFVFRLPDGTEIDRASTLYEFEKKLHTVPDDSLLYHSRADHFSHWVMARAEIALASRLSRHHFSRIDNPDHLREDIIFKVNALRRLRQKGVVTQFSGEDFDPEVTDFVRIGNGSLGGKARGIAFVGAQLQKDPRPDTPVSGHIIHIPKTCVITTQGFNDFVALNAMVPDEERSDAEIADCFLQAEMPGWLLADLRAFLAKVQYPLSIRSSSMLEDAQFRPYAGLYSTFMLTNSDPDFEVRLGQLVRAVKLVYASTWFEGPRSFSRSINQDAEDSMAVIIQQLAGRRYGTYFYPAVSGTIQSYNFYPLSPMQPEDGIAYIALGFGKTVVEGEGSLRFSPTYPKNLPQLSTTEDILKNTQRWFYCLDWRDPAGFNPENSNLIRREIDEAADEYPVRMLSSTYFPEEDRIRDADMPGPKVLTFASLLKYDRFPIGAVMQELIRLGRQGMGCEVEMEFALDLDPDPLKSTFSFLQIRPIVTLGTGREVKISRADRGEAVIYSAQSLGHGLFDSMQDIVYVKPESFAVDATREIAAEITRLNSSLVKEGKKYLLLGFGRWGSADPWLGIPVKWQNISGCGAIIEVQGRGITAEPSQGTHFFQNLTSLGIPYLMIAEQGAAGQEDKSRGETVEWSWLDAREARQGLKYVRHVRLPEPLILKVDGHAGEAVVLVPSDTGNN